MEKKSHTGTDIVSFKFARRSEDNNQNQNHYYLNYKAGQYAIVDPGTKEYPEGPLRSSVSRKKDGKFAEDWQHIFDPFETFAFVAAMTEGSLNSKPSTTIFQLQRQGPDLSNSRIHSLK